MSIRAMTAVWDMDLPATEKLIMLALADCANDDGECWPSIATIQRKTGCGERTVQRSLRAAEEKGLIKRVEVIGKGCRYFVNPRQNDTPANLSPVPHRRRPPPQCHPTPATVAPKPSKNLQEPIKQTQSAQARVNLEDWKPEEFPADSKAHEIANAWSADELAARLEHFIAHHRGKGAASRDWQSAWKAWVLNSPNVKAPRKATKASRTQAAQPAVSHKPSLSAEKIAENKARQMQFDDLMRRLALGECTQAEIDALSEQTKLIAAERGHLRRHDDGSFTSRTNARLA